MRSSRRALFTPLPRQIIPNPNQDRLGLPAPPSPASRQDKAQRQAALRQAHQQALAYAGQLLSLATQLRNDLKTATAPDRAQLRKRCEQIQRLAAKIRTNLKP